MDISLDDSNVLTNDNSDDELTSDQVLKELQKTWINERFAPEILPNRADLVECMLGQLHHMERNLKKLKKNDLTAIVHQLEIDRIRYIVSSYMRTRLEKIELYTHSILNAEQERIESDTQYLSPEEYEFAKDFLTNQEILFQGNGMRFMPGTSQQIDWKEASIEPNLNSHVFFKVKEDVRGLIVGNELVDLEKHSQHIMPYSTVVHLLKNDKIQLI